MEFYSITVGAGIVFINLKGGDLSIEVFLFGSCIKNLFNKMNIQEITYSYQLWYNLNQRFIIS